MAGRSNPASPPGEGGWPLPTPPGRRPRRGGAPPAPAPDVDESAREQPRRGVYGQRSFRLTPAWVQARWLTARADGWEVDPRLRRRVRFAPREPATRAPPAEESGTGGNDLLLCRHGPLYFTAQARARAATPLAPRPPPV